MGSDGKMTLYIYSKLAATRDTNIKLKAFNQTTITQFCIRRLKIEHNYKYKMCNFFVVSGNGQAILGMPDIEILSLLIISCNTIGTMKADKNVNYTANRPVSCSVGGK